jgi:hypothetical protein
MISVGVVEFRQLISENRPDRTGDMDMHHNTAAVVRKTVPAASICVGLCMLGACTEPDSYTLYRNSPMDKNMRIHVATFDAVDGDRYNVENCQTARTLFEGQPGVRVRYWCEKGRFRG